MLLCLDRLSIPLSAPFTRTAQRHHKISSFACGTLFPHSHFGRHLLRTEAPAENNREDAFRLCQLSSQLLSGFVTQHLIKMMTLLSQTYCSGQKPRETRCECAVMSFCLDCTSLALREITFTIKADDSLLLIEYIKKGWHAYEPKFSRLQKL